jgi:hypothetical protein
MKICRFSFENQTKWGALVNDLIHPFENFSFDNNFSDFIKSENYVKRNDALFCRRLFLQKLCVSGEIMPNTLLNLEMPFPKSRFFF